MSIAASASSSATTLSGLASGLDWTSIINEMVAAEQAPETQMEAQQTTLQNREHLLHRPSGRTWRRCRRT